MYKFFITIILISSFGCKSIKKSKDLEVSTTISQNQNYEKESELEENTSISKLSFLESKNKLEYTEVEENITETFTSLVSSDGKEVVVPVKTSTFKKKIFKSDDSLTNSNKFNENTQLESSVGLKSNLTNELSEEILSSLDKQSESSEVVENTLGNMFGGWAKIIAGIIASLLAIGWKIYQGRKE
jgi:hypothetical protein